MWSTPTLRWHNSSSKVSTSNGQGSQGECSTRQGPMLSSKGIQCSNSTSYAMCSSISTIPWVFLNLSILKSNTSLHVNNQVIPYYLGLNALLLNAPVFLDVGSPSKQTTKPYMCASWRKSPCHTGCQHPKEVHHISIESRSSNPWVSYLQCMCPPRYNQG
jgi:hypothetical protein